jgi:hypothetical protein
MQLPVLVPPHGDKHSDKHYVNSHTSMSGVVPAWKLATSFLRIASRTNARMTSGKRAKKAAHEPGGATSRN